MKLSGKFEVHTRLQRLSIRPRGQLWIYDVDIRWSKARKILYEDDVM